MIHHPKSGQRVQLWYRKSAVSTMPHHARFGRVVECGRGKGPRNAAVKFDDGTLVVVPRGNLKVASEGQPVTSQPLTFWEWNASWKVLNLARKRIEKLPETMSWCRFNSCDFSRVRADHMHLTPNNRVFVSSKLAGAESCEWNECLFDSAGFLDVWWSDCRFNKCSLEIDTRDMHFALCEFNGCFLDGWKSKDDHVVHVSFKDCSWRKCDIEAMKVRDCTFIGCDFSGGAFHACQFGDCRFIGCDLSDVSLPLTSLFRCEFIACKLPALTCTGPEKLTYATPPIRALEGGALYSPKFLNDAPSLDWRPTETLPEDYYARG